MTMQEAHERIEQANNEIAKLQEEIKRLQEIEDEPDIQRVGAGEPFWYIQLGDYGVNVIQCNEPTGRSCYDITETIGTRLFRNSNYFLSKERAEHEPLCAKPPGQCRKLIIKFFHVLTCHNRCVRSMGLYPHSQRHISPDGRL